MQDWPATQALCRVWTLSFRVPIYLVEPAPPFYFPHPQRQLEFSSHLAQFPSLGPSPYSAVSCRLCLVLLPICVWVLPMASSSCPWYFLGLHTIPIGPSYPILWSCSCDKIWPLAVPLLVHSFLWSCWFTQGFFLGLYLYHLPHSAYSACCLLIDTTLYVISLFMKM